MSEGTGVADHYGSGSLLETLKQNLREDGIDPEHPTIEALAPYDQFHGRGLEATSELADVLEVSPGQHILDVGSGVGGPARYFADRFGCRVTGIDLTEEFCDVARHLTQVLGLEDKVSIEHGNALAMPFEDAAFDGAYSMNVSMNIADKAAFYAEVHRVLKPGAWFMLSEIAQGPGGAVDYPTPWAAIAANSHLSTPQQTEDGLRAAGFEIRQSRDTVEAVLAFGARARAIVERGEKPPHRAIAWIHGEIAAEAMGNSGEGVKTQRLVPIEVLCTKGQ